MKAIFQINFTSGLGDLLVGLSEILTLAYKLKNYNCNMQFIFNYSNNKYITNINHFLELIDPSSFDIFDSCVYHDYSINNTIINNCNHIYTLSGVNPGIHWWDLYCDENAKNLIQTNNLLSIFAQIHNAFDININEKIKLPIFTNNFYKYLNNINILNNNYITLYFRNLDYSHTNQNYSKNTLIINELCKKNNDIYICSNSKIFKHQFIKNNYNDVNLKIFDTANLNIDYHFTKSFTNIEEEQAILLQALTDMHLLSRSKEVHCFSDWGRMSNFLFLTYINNTSIHFYD